MSNEILVQKLISTTKNTKLYRNKTSTTINTIELTNANGHKLKVCLWLVPKNKTCDKCTMLRCNEYVINDNDYKTLDFGSNGFTIDKIDCEIWVQCNYANALNVTINGHKGD